MNDPVTPIVDDALGNSSYVVDLGDGGALVVDPQRDPRVYGDAIVAVAETHLHADFVSGSRELNARTAATILAPKDAELGFDHRPVIPSDEIALGAFTLRVLPTPGHTPEHVSYLLLDGRAPVALFSGGALLPGSVARTDLISPDQTEPLARALYRSLRTAILNLPDDLVVYPTHGGGSFCSAPAGRDRTTTIGRERESNPFLRAEHEDDFVALLQSKLGTYPPYFLRLRAFNRAGPALIDSLPSLEALDADAFERRAETGAVVIDARPVRDWAAGHIPGALSIALRPAFTTWLGWLVEQNTKLLFVMNDDQDRDELLGACRSIGYDSAVGELRGGMSAWREEQRTVPTSRASDFDGPVVDVRQRDEYERGHAPGASSIELGSIPHRLSDVPAGPIGVMCGHGERAATAASMLERDGRTDVTVLLP